MFRAQQLVIDLLMCMFFFFFFNDTATTEIYTLSLHDALPISTRRGGRLECRRALRRTKLLSLAADDCDSNFVRRRRSEEHTSELQSLTNLVCRLLLEKKKKTTKPVQIDQRTNGHQKKND